MLNVLIVGATGYVGVELINYLHRHKNVSIKGLFVSNNSEDVGKKISDVHKKFKKIIDLPLQSISNDLFKIVNKVNAVFLATDHLVSHNLVPSLLSHGITVFDLSGAFRINNCKVYQKYYNFKHNHKDWLEKSIYGLAEWNRKKIVKAQLISVPGCYATAVQLGLKPIIKFDLIDISQKPIINAISGVSGSGRKSNLKNSICEMSIHPYNIFKHRHQPEINKHLGISVLFIPHLGGFSRGIIATIVCRLRLGVKIADMINAFHFYYDNKPLIRIYNSELPSLKSVIGLPFCDIGFVVKYQYVSIVVTEDNLLKGAAAQAIQCFNIRFGFDEIQSLL